MTVPNSVHKPQFSPYEKNARGCYLRQKITLLRHRRRSGVRPPPLSPPDWRVIPRCATACSLKSCDFTGTTAASCHTHRGYARPPTSRELGMVQIRGRKPIARARMTLGRILPKVDRAASRRLNNQRRPVAQLRCWSQETPGTNSSPRSKNLARFRRESCSL